jgi:transaldolase/glucose-6-phosphate isomerase
METIAKLGISMKEVTDKLTDDGVRLFAEAFDKLLEAVEKSTKSPATAKVSKPTYKLPGALAGAVKTNIDDWRALGKVRRLWQRDASLWTGTDEAKWLDWLNITAEQIARIQDLRRVVEDAKKEGFTDLLLLGMGGSSLCPEVLKMTFGKIAGFPELHVLDSTDPAQLKAFENKVNLAKTLFVVSSKSGTTLEPNIFKQYFFERCKEVVGAEKVGSRFVAVTDPGSKLQQVAEADRFRHIFPGVAGIGGRYSALSNFGVAPAALMGLDVGRFLSRTQEMVDACGPASPVDENPGVLLGIVLGTAARNGRDKVTIITSPGISDLGAWLEQLMAESTGKQGKGIVPVDREELAAPELYGNDRLFAYVRLDSAPNAAQDAKVAALEQAGQAVVRVALADIHDLGQEFFRWEIATAVAGSIVGINAFNQPDVEASKVETRKLTTEYESSGKLPPESSFFTADGAKLYADVKNAAELKGGGTLTGFLKKHLSRIGSGDYFAVLGYITMNEAHEQALEAIRLAVRDNKKVATVLGFGPRFLHSTGQAYKGGPNSGVFLQITCDDAVDILVPGQKYTFGVVKAAQARGDFAVLAERGRRALRVHLGKDVAAGLATLTNAVHEALA